MRSSYGSGGRASARRVLQASSSVAAPGRVREGFSRFARAATLATGSPMAFAIAVVLVGTWLVVGFAWGFTPEWTLAMNSLATFVTFLMVFLIQSAANRNAQVEQLKLDELLASHPNASNLLIDLEGLSEEEIAGLHAQYQHLADRCASLRRRRGAVSIETPDPAPSRLEGDPWR